MAGGSRSPPARWTASETGPCRPCCRGTDRLGWKTEMESGKTARSTPGRLSPRRLAAIAVGHPRRVLAVWGVVVLVGFGLISGLLESALSSEADVTSNSESKQAEELIDERFPDRDALDELVIVRSDELV